MAHVKVVERREDGEPTPTPPETKIRAQCGGVKFGPFFTAVYVGDHLQIGIDSTLTTTLYNSNCVSLFIFGYRAFVGHGGGGSNTDTHSSTSLKIQNHGLGHHNRPVRLHYQLLHYENFGSARKH